MRGPDQFLAVIVAVMFLTGLIVTYLSVHQRAASQRNWDSELVGTRGPSAGKTLQRPVPADRS
jgi:hypothetical protein